MAKTIAEAAPDFTRLAVTAWLESPEAVEELATAAFKSGRSAAMPHYLDGWGGVPEWQKERWRDHAERILAALREGRGG